MCVCVCVCNCVYKYSSAVDLKSSKLCPIKSFQVLEHVAVMYWWKSVMFSAAVMKSALHMNK